ncbi:hypothetical protein FSP39_019667 [Pinctada imbricata]|uniref:Uncharacterized protein n=1 Tax=Pinctada imbricata TaxID=66713 RepID=A0AA88YL05_PINIB|nr:hypothetical protein FSP39_019667 [Pinctada imbricata]
MIVFDFLPIARIKEKVVKGVSKRVKEDPDDTFVSCESSSEVSRERIFVSAERVGVLSAEIDDDDDDDVDDDDDTDDIIDVRGRGKSSQAASRAERRKNALSMIAQLRLLRKLKSRVAKNLSWRSFLRLIKSLKQKSSFHLLLKSLTKKKSISSKPVQSKSKLPSLKLLSKINNNKTKTISLNVNPSPKINYTSSNPTSKRPNKSTISSIPPQSLQPKLASSITKPQTSSSSKSSSASSGIQSGPQLKKSIKITVGTSTTVCTSEASIANYVSTTTAATTTNASVAAATTTTTRIPNYLVTRKSENKVSTRLSSKTVQSTNGTMASSQTKTSFSSKGHLSNFPTDTSFNTKQASSLNRVSLISNPPKITQSRQSKQAQIWIPNVNSKTQARQSSIKNSISNDNEETYSIHIPMPSPPPTPTTPKPTGTSKPIQTVYIQDASFTKSNINPATANLGLRQSTELKKSIEPSFPKLISQGIPIMNVFSDNDKANTVPSIGNSKSVTLKSKDRPSLTNTQDSNYVINSLSTNRHMSKSLDEESMVSLISNSNNKNTNSAVVIPKATQWTFPVVRNSQTVSISSPKLLASPTSPGAAIIPSVLEDTKSSSSSKPMNKTTLVKKEVTLRKDTKVITKALDEKEKPRKELRAMTKRELGKISSMGPLTTKTFQYRQKLRLT